MFATVQKAVVEDGDRHPSYSTSYKTASASKIPIRQRFGLFGGTLAIAILIAASVVHRERTDPQQLPAGTTTAGRPAVTGGSFRLPQDFATEACALIEAQFVSDTDCQCSLSESSAVMYGCRHAAMSCREHEHHLRGENDGVCATLTYTGEVSLDRPVVLASSVSTSEFCLQSLYIGMERVGDLCVRLVRGSGGGGAISEIEESNSGAAAAAADAATSAL